MEERDELKKQGKADASVSPDPVEEIMPSEYLGEVKASKSPLSPAPPPLAGGGIKGGG